MDRYLRDKVATMEKAIVKLYGKLTFGASGAVTADCEGFDVAVVAATDGRYTVTLEDQYPEFKGCNVTMQVADAAAVGATAGVIPVVRDVDMSSKSFLLQFIDPTDGSDADPTSGFIAYVEIALKNSTV